MSQKSDIEWTGKTWNFLRARVKKDAVQIAHEKGYSSLFKILTGVKSDGTTPRVVPGETWGYHCEIASDGCGNCYACTMNGRTLPAWGTGLPYDRRLRDLVDIYIDETELLKPLSWKKPTKIFPCSMTDLFADFVPDEFIDRAFAVMALCQQHTFQVLTKRAERMLNYLSGAQVRLTERHELDKTVARGAPLIKSLLRTETIKRLRAQTFDESINPMPWPLRNVQLGFSAEDQPNFYARWAYMQRLATAGWFVWVSLEPLLGPINLRLFGI